jgi:group I intron endonuclease
MSNGVYMILNIISKKVYIGSTYSKRGFSGRWYEHKKLLKRNKHPNIHLQNAHNKYGLYCFEFSVMEECSEKECESKEQYWIDFFNSMDANCGYNLVSANHKKQSKETIEKRRQTLLRIYASGQRKVTDEMKSNISKALSGRKLSKERIEKCRISHIGLKYKKGWKHSEETKELFSKQRMGKIAWNKGKKLRKRTEQEIEKFRIAQRKRRLNESTKNI